MKQSLTSQTIKGFLWLSTGKGSKAILQLVIIAILARLLTPADFGLIGLALIVVSFSDIFTDLGFGPAITQKVTLNEEDIRTGFTFSIIFGVMLVGAIWPLAPLFSIFFQAGELTWILRFISLVLLFKAASSVAIALLYRKMDYRGLAIIEMISFTIGYGFVGTVLAYIDFGVWALVGAVLGQAFISSTLLLFYSVHPKTPMFNLQSLKELVLFGGGYSLGKIFSYIGNKGDKIVIGRFLGTDALGLYERAYQLVKFIAGLIGEVIDKVLFAPIAKKQNERKRLGVIYLELTYIISFLLFPLSTLIFVNAREIVLFLFGQQWLAIVFPIQLMSVSLFFLVSSRIGSTLAKSLGDVYSRAFRNFIFASLIVGGSILAIPWDIVGVTVAILMAFLVNYLMAFTQTRKLTGISVKAFIGSHFLGLIVSAGYAGVVFHVTEYLRVIDGYSSLIILLINGLILLTFYVACFLCLPLQIIQDYRGKVLATFKPI